MNYKDKILTFEASKIYYNDANASIEMEVMMDWEDAVMKKSANYVCENGGDILEIGFGMGIAANYIQANSITSHTIVENHPQIIEKAKAWAADKPNVTIVEGNWYDKKDILSTYDGLFYDTYGDGICCQYGTGSYSITDDSGNVIVSGGEFSSTESTTFRVGESLGLNSFIDENLKIFPNPSNGVFTIKTTLTNSSYKVHNLIGQTIKSGFINNGINSIDIRNSIDGIYFITIESKNGEKIGYKLIKN